MISDNHADYGGGIFGFDATIRDVEITGCVAATSGGGLLVSGTSTVSDVTVTDSLAVLGGGVAVGVLSPAIVVVERCEITGNDAEEGGGVYAHAADLDIADSTLADNTGGNGGALYLANSDTTVTGSRLVRNDSASGGGAHMWNGLLTSASTDWGAGADDNGPDDVYTGIETFQGAGDFVCDRVCTTTTTP